MVDFLLDSTKCHVVISSKLSSSSAVQLSDQHRNNIFQEADMPQGQQLFWEHSREGKKPRHMTGENMGDTNIDVILLSEKNCKHLRHHHACSNANATLFSSR